MAKSESEKTDFRERIRNLVSKLTKGSPAPQATHRTQTRDFVLTPDVLREICPESPANNRIRTIRDLSEVVRRKHLEENGIEALWRNISDLVQPQVNPESRNIALNFLKCLLEGQLPNLGIMRGYFFLVIQDLTSPDDLRHRLDLFITLSENGKNLHDFEDETGPFLLGWMPEVISVGYIGSFLSLLVNVIKFNAAYLYEDEVAGLVQQTCMIPNSVRLDEEQNLKLCVSVLDSVVSYSYLPTSALYHFVAALCHLVNKPKFCDISWELMRKLLGTHLGHSSVYTMCCMLQDSKHLADCLLLRGAIFFIGMALWGAHRVSSLQSTPTSVLPSFKQVLSTSDWLVTYEVTKSVQRLVRKYGKDLQHITWDILLDIIEIILKQLGATQPSSESRGGQDTVRQCEVEIHDVLSAVEDLYRRGHFLGAPTRFFHMIELCSSRRSESSVVMLMDYQAQTIHPGKENWINSLNQLMDKYFRQETRTEIRKKALDKLSFVLSINKHIYENELIERVVLHHLGHIETDPDPEVRRLTAEMLLVLTQDCKTTEFEDLMNIIEKLIKKPLTVSAPLSETDKIVHVDENSIIDVRTAVLKLCDVFKHRLFVVPSSYCVNIYNLLVSHVNSHYTHSYMGYSAGCIRKTVLEMLLQLRSDSLNRIGLTESGHEGPSPFSPYITCKLRQDSDHHVPLSPVSGSSGSPWYQPPAMIQYTDAFQLYLTCLQHEEDWQVLKCVLENLPLVLQNKTLILTTTENMVTTLCHQLCAMVNDKSLGFPDKLQSLPSRFTRSDFHSYVFPVLATMVTYHDYLDRNGQKELLKCLEFGLVSKCAKTCVSALRISSLEMQEVMMRMLPSVLLSLSKISATISMAIPVLAFLSSIVRLPSLYANFVEDQYMSVFAIALPYTNPFKFSHYTVSLAHHVIAIWFIRCRLPFRKGFVKFIHKGLKANVLQQFEENAVHNLQSHEIRQQDSSSRSRSGSYSEGARVRRRMVSGSAVTRRDPPPVDEKMNQFHSELTETCMDMMARYVFANFRAVPHRSKLVEFLLAGTQSQTWLVGNRVVTITTSGSGMKAPNASICEKCAALYQEAQGSKRSFVIKQNRRRHKSAACLSRSQSQVDPVVSPSVEESPAKWSHDDLSIPIPTSDDVAVQTGSSLSGDSLDSLLFGVSSDTDKLAPGSLVQCTCWCSGWAEIYIRGPCGNMSWVMRVENQTETSQACRDMSLQDITMLFKPVQPSTSNRDQDRKIDSESLGEEEYETLYSKHFSGCLDDSSIVAAAPSIQSSYGYDRAVPSSSSSNETTSTISGDQSSVSLHKTQSSPSLMEPHSEDQAARETTQAVCDQKSPKDGEDTREPGKQKDSQPSYSPKPETTTGGTEQTPHYSLSVKGKASNDALTRSKSYPLSAEGEDRQAGTPNSQNEDHQVGTVVESPSITEERADSSPVKKRGHTISVMTPAQSLRYSDDGESVGRSVRGKESRNGISPSFVFLQLFHSHPLLSGGDTPVLLPQTETIDRALRMLDLIHPYETHKIGVIYVGAGQCNDEKRILCNLSGSERYIRFMQGLGELIHLQDIDPEQVYVGGLALTGTDGQFAYSWQDESMQVIFHVATLMPNRESDPNCNAKKLHIGNDFVTIVYNDSGDEYKMGTIKGQFNYVNIIIRPLDYESNAVTLQTKEVPSELMGRISTDIADILGHTDTKIISDSNLAALVRQIAIHCNLASVILQRQQSQPQDPFASKWLERLRQIKRIREKVRQEEKSSGVDTVDDLEQKPTHRGRSFVEDFTDYV